MRRIITGVDDEGRSCVVEESSFDGSVETIYETATSPPPARAGGHGADVDLGVAPGIARWIHVVFAPGAETPLHHTDTVDFDTIISGYVDIVLDDGPHRLGAGDCVLVAGVDHGWRAGPEGCTSSVIVLGTPPYRQPSRPGSGFSPPA